MIDNFTRYLGVCDQRWSYRSREALKDLIASFGATAIDPVLDEVVRCERQDIIDDADATLTRIVTFDPDSVAKLRDRLYRTEPVVRELIETVIGRLT